MPKKEENVQFLDWDSVVYSHSFNVDGWVPRDTGILDQHGKKIIRYPKPIGFTAKWSEE
jgi:hypothetical protein